MKNAMTDFDIVIFHFLDGDPFYGAYTSQLIKIAKVCSLADDFNARNKCLTA